MIILKPSKQSLKIAVEIINKGGIVICPTDTVYGFLSDASNKKAVEKIFKIKKRPKNKPLPIFVKDLKMANELSDISESQMKILKSKWPGKYTFILKSKFQNPNFKNDTIALRIPKYKFLNDLLNKINKPLSQTSVNISGQPPMTKIKDIINSPEIGSRVDLIIDGGNLKELMPSKIIDLTNNKYKILRK